ncbi:MAG: helix-turn-helix transcriptional regulator [Solirubrobacterales bacterium]
MPTEPAPALPKNFLRPCLLLLLRENRAHGYELLEQVQSLGFDRSDPGGLYRTLRGLEREKLVRSVWEPSEQGPDRRIYEITRSGMQELHGAAKAISRGEQAIASFRSRYEEFVALDAKSAAPRRTTAGSR